MHHHSWRRVNNYFLERCSILVCLVICFPMPAVADDAISGLIAGLQEKYAAAQSVSASFRQIYRAPGIEQVESGSLLMKKPGLMRWEYRDPERKVFIADGRETFFYTPEDRQVQVSALTSAEIRSTPLQFLLGRGEILKSYRALP